MVLAGLKGVVVSFQRVLVILTTADQGGQNPDNNKKFHVNIYAIVKNVPFLFVSDNCNLSAISNQSYWYNQYPWSATIANITLKCVMGVVSQHGMVTRL